MKATHLFLLLFITLALASPVFAQTVTGSLVGNVTDQSGSLIPGATVTVTELKRGFSRTNLTNERGIYSIQSLEPGVYRVEVELPGFKKFVREPIEVTINSTVRVNATLEVGEVTQSVEVIGETPSLKTDRADVSFQVKNKEVENLPLTLDRNFQSLFELVPGSTPPRELGSSLGNPVGAIAPSINGQNDRYNNFQLDGTINNQGNVISELAIVPTADTIETVDISTNSYDAEHGGATGAVVNVRTKSGGNDLHGSLYYYNTNSALKARNALSQLEEPVTNLNQFGFTLGGPIEKNRTFFFGGYQGTRNREGQNTIESVPTAAFRKGDFSASPTVVYDPKTGDSGGAKRQAFAGNVIPANRLSPVALAIVNRLPLPNMDGLQENYAAAGTFKQNRDQVDGKINHIFSDRTEGFVRYSYFSGMSDDAPVFGVIGGPTTGGGGTAASGPSRIQNASANVTHTFSGTLITEVRGGLSRVLIEGDIDTEPDLADQVGIPGINDGGFYSSGLPRIEVSGYSFLGSIGTMPFKIVDTSYNLVNNWTKERGAHSFRFGGEFRNVILNGYQSTGNPRGLFSFTTGVTALKGATTSSANAFAAFMLGLPQSINRAVMVTEGGTRSRMYSLFFQDRWQASSKLTFNYGLRYEIFPGALAAKPGDKSTYDAVNNQLLVAGFGSVNRRMNIGTDYRNFAPRLGLAYRLSDKTVLRAGYGIGYVPLLITRIGGSSYPAQVNVQQTGANSFQPASDISQGIPVPPPVDVSDGIIEQPDGKLAFAIYNPHLRRGYIQSFNVALQHDFFGWVAEAAYVGSLSTRMPGQQNINAVGPGGKNADLPLNKTFGRTATTEMVDYMLSAAYHGLQTSVDRRFGNGGNVKVTYTWSKALDYADAFALSNDIILDLNRGPSQYNRPHNMTVSHVLPLPFGRGQKFLNDGGPAANIFGGWMISGIFSARNSAPVTVTGNNLAENKPVGTTNGPDATGRPRILGGTGRGELWFDTSVFAEPAAGKWGNAGRNSIWGPNYYNYSATIARNFLIQEKYTLQFSAIMHNLTNTTHFNNPSGSFTSTAFGQIQSSYGERRVQLGLRLTF